MRNGWIRKVLPSKYTVPSPGAIPFEAQEHVQTMKHNYPPSLNRMAFLVGKLPISPIHAAGINPKASNPSFPKDPVHMMMKFGAARRKENILRARLNIGGKFFKDVATTVTEKNEISLYQRLQNVLADYGKVSFLPLDSHETIISLKRGGLYHSSRMHRSNCELDLIGSLDLSRFSYGDHCRQLLCWFEGPAWTKTSCLMKYVADFLIS